MKPTGVISTAVLFLFIGNTGGVYAQRLDKQTQDEKHEQYGQQQQARDQQGRGVHQQDASRQQRLPRQVQQQARLQNNRDHDYDRDPYFYTPANYRYIRGGRYYETNEYGANLLRQAVNNGYEEGFGAGQADRQDRWAPDYRTSYAYQDANYGYDGYYVDQDDYNYYFREGFQRGYGDGYNSRYQYGRNSNGTYIVLDVVLSQILNFQSLR
jgi:hypothetical protein